MVVKKSSQREEQELGKGGSEISPAKPPRPFSGASSTSRRPDSTLSGRRTGAGCLARSALDLERRRVRKSFEGADE
jgi:hypothetical protein